MIWEPDLQNTEKWDDEEWGYFLSEVQKGMELTTSQNKDRI